MYVGHFVQPKTTAKLSIDSIERESNLPGKYRIHGTATLNETSYLHSAFSLKLVQSKFTYGLSHRFTTWTTSNSANDKKRIEIQLDMRRIQYYLEQKLKVNTWDCNKLQRERRGKTHTHITIEVIYHEIRIRTAHNQMAKVLTVFVAD